MPLYDVLFSMLLSTCIVQKVYVSTIVLFHVCRQKYNIIIMILVYKSTLLLVDFKATSL